MINADLRAMGMAGRRAKCTTDRPLFLINSGTVIGAAIGAGERRWEMPCQNWVYDTAIPMNGRNEAMRAVPVEGHPKNKTGLLMLGDDGGGVRPATAWFRATRGVWGM